MPNENNSVYDKIIAIHDEAMSVLQSMHIPPYPIHYQKQFNIQKKIITISNFMKTIKYSIN